MPPPSATIITIRAMIAYSAGMRRCGRADVIASRRAPSVIASHAEGQSAALPPRGEAIPREHGTHPLSVRSRHSGRLLRGLRPRAMTTGKRALVSPHPHPCSCASAGAGCCCVPLPQCRCRQSGGSPSPTARWEKGRGDEGASPRSGLRTPSPALQGRVPCAPLVIASHAEGQSAALPPRGNLPRARE